MCISVNMKETCLLSSRWKSTTTVLNTCINPLYHFLQDRSNSVCYHNVNHNDRIHSAVACLLVLVKYEISTDITMRDLITAAVWIKTHCMHLGMV
jgi:hypothetical protein